MDYKLERKVVSITLELSKEEFHTLVASMGASTYYDARDTAKTNGLKIVSERESNLLYSKLKKIAREEI